MTRIERRLSDTFKAFASSSKAGGIVLITCALIAIVWACAVLGDGQTACYGETGAVLRIDLSGRKEPAHVLARVMAASHPLVVGLAALVGVLRRVYM